MIKRLLLSLLAFALVMPLHLKAQKCATLMPWQEEEVIATHSQAELENMKSAFFKNIKVTQHQSPKKEVLIVPMVVHVIHNYGPENVSETAINLLVRNLNLDFNYGNPNYGSVFDEFKDIVADCEIEFRLAKIDPDGNCTNGITRTVVNDPYFANRSGGRNEIENLKRQLNWSTDKYMNVYVVGSISESGGGRTLGYATFPRNSPFSTDGFVTIYEGIGSSGDLGGTSTHEIGHYLGLPHTFGPNNDAGNPNNCTNGGDGIDDTPTTTGHFSTCPGRNDGAVTCGSLDNVRNIMDYANCSANFTNGQKAVMRGVLGNQRSKLVSQSNLEEVGAAYPVGGEPQFLCTADFVTSYENESCPGVSVEFESFVTHGATSYSWEFEGGTPAVSSEENPEVVYNTPGSFDVTLTVSDGDSTIVVLKEDFIKVRDNNLLGSVISEDFEDLNLSTDDVFFVENEDNDRTWTIFNQTGEGGSAKSIYIDNSSIIGSGKKDELITNTMNTIPNQDDLYIYFDYAFAAKKDENSDKLSVLFSKDCGETWAQRKALLGSNLRTAPNQASGDFVPNADQWDNEGIKIGQYASEGFLCKLVWESGGGNNIYIDNFYIGNKAELGINEKALAKQVVSLYPNPSNGRFVVSSSWSNLSQIEVKSLAGKTILTQSASGQESVISLEQFPAGIYFVSTTLENGKVENVRLVKNQ